ncbi:MAG TPA: class I SAM-dependent methyltransferase family protein [Vicinamibacterales bacterium]|nr:class I SAM-dependent methyltransferase family protein [Vicinamibacterales bacterium]
MPRYYNRTRESASLPLALLRRGRVLALPLYAALRRSDLAREGFDHSGSYRFADHIYRAQPSGRGAFGRWLDARLLALPAVRSFRSRFEASRDELAAFLRERADRPGPLDVLSAPCGIPRELADGYRAFLRSGASAPAQLLFHGLDLDAGALDEATRFAAHQRLEPFVPHRGDVFDRAAYPAGVDFITCTGLAEFLDDERLAELYGIFFERLRPGGVFVTSGMRGRPLSDYLLRLAELRIHYRTAQDLERLARRFAFSRIETRTDSLGIQAILVARR